MKLQEPRLLSSSLQWYITSAEVNHAPMEGVAHARTTSNTAWI